MDILKFPNPFLITATYQVTVFGDELKVLLDSMYEVMKEHNGIGLAANQVGLLHRMFVMEGPKGRINIVNPAIVSSSIQKINVREGCLSAPGTFVVIPTRASWVQLCYSDETGKSNIVTLKDVHAVCVQHEIDHLDGKIFMLDKSIPKHERKCLAKKWGIK